MIGSLQGTAFVVLLLGVPLLALAMVLARRGSGRWLLAWFGVLTFIAYQGVLFLFATPFNAFFHVYVALLALPTWSLIVLLARLPVDRVAARFDPRAAVRPYAAYLALSGAFYAVLWLRATAPAVLDAGPPAFLEGTGMTTGPGQILDLGFSVPVLVLAGWLLWHRRPWGYVLAGGLLVMTTIESVSIAVDQWLGHLADPASTVVGIEVVPVFAALAVLGAGLTAAFLRSSEGSSGADDFGLSIDLDVTASAES